MGFSSKRIYYLNIPPDGGSGRGIVMGILLAGKKDFDIFAARKYVPCFLSPWEVYFGF